MSAQAAKLAAAVARLFDLAQRAAGRRPADALFADPLMDRAINFSEAPAPLPPLRRRR